MKHIGRLIPTTKQNAKLPNTLTLREGQLVTGKVMKFYPGQKALINLSGHQIVAKVDASLQANQNYILQVKGTSPNIQLKVVHDTAIQSYEDAALTLLKLSGVKATQSEQLTLANLLKQQLPIKLEQVASLLQLLRNNHVPNQPQIISEILNRQLPLNQQVFQAIHQKFNRPISFAQVVDQIQNQLQQTPVNSVNYDLFNQINLLSSKSINENKLMEVFTYQILKEVGRGSQTTFQLLQKAGIINQQLSFQEWSSNWSNWAKQNQITFTLNQNPPNLSGLPYNFSINDVMNALTSLNQKQIESPGLIRQISSLIQLLNTQTASEQLTTQQQQLTQSSLRTTPWTQISNQLQGNHQSTLNELQLAISQQNGTELSQIMKSDRGKQLLVQLNQIIDSQVGSSAHKALSFWGLMASSSAQTDAFNGNMIKHFMQLTSVDMNPKADYPTLPNLINSAQFSSLTLSDSLQSMNQILQSMHLSQSDANHRDWMNFNVQIPKDILGLNQDLYMEFEGKKQDDGKIHPRQCRVIFYLDLPRLNQTIIDMHVQNNHVDLTVFHEKPEKLKLITQKLLNSMEGQFNQLGYSTMQVQFKSLYERTQTDNEFKPSRNDLHQGVDFRI